MSLQHQDAGSIPAWHSGLKDPVLPQQQQRRSHCGSDLIPGPGTHVPQGGQEKKKKKKRRFTLSQDLSLLVTNANGQHPSPFPRSCSSLLKKLHPGSWKFQRPHALPLCWLLPQHRASTLGWSLSLFSQEITPGRWWP